MPHTTQSSPAEAAIRPATSADIDDLVELYKTTAPLEESFRYRNQYVHHLLISPKYSDFDVMVAEAPSLEDVTATKVVAYAVWDVSYRNKRQYGAQHKSQNGKARQNSPSASIRHSIL